MDQSKFTVIIPSKVVDDNLLNCEKKIRQFYKKIKVLLMIDGESNNLNLSNCTEIIPTGLVNVAEKRNIGFRQCNTEFIVFIDSDAYPEHPWLDEIEKVFRKNPSVGACIEAFSISACSASYIASISSGKTPCSGTSSGEGPG